MGISGFFCWLTQARSYWPSRPIYSHWSNQKKKESLLYEPGELFQSLFIYLFFNYDVPKEYSLTTLQKWTVGHPIYRYSSFRDGKKNNFQHISGYQKSRATEGGLPPSPLRIAWSMYGLSWMKISCPHRTREASSPKLPPPQRCASQNSVGSRGRERLRGAARLCTDLVFNLVPVEIPLIKP